MQNDARSIVVCDRSALHFFQSCDWRPDAQKGCAEIVRHSYASSAQELRDFNTKHPLFGGEPVSVFAPKRSLRVSTNAVVGHLVTGVIPDGSLCKLREGLYVASPELTFLRMGNHANVNRLAEMGMMLCARYYIELETGCIRTRSRFLTTPEKLRAFCDESRHLRGAVKALEALRWVLPNSGSPLETKMKLQFCHPYWKGGFALPFDAMNYDVKAGRSQNIAEQAHYCIDLVARSHRVGLEYDGQDYHSDTSRDKRRLNALRAMGWDVFPADKSILYCAEETERLGYQIAKHMGIRVQKPRLWESRYAELRNDLGLPV